MKCVLLVFAFCLTHNLLAQDFVYPLSVGDKWQLFQILPGFGTSLMQIEVTGDSVLPNGHTYARLDDYPTYRRQQGNQVLMFSPADGRDYIMYDFSRSIGDTVGTFAAGNFIFDVVLRDSGSIMAFGQRRRSFTFYHVARNAIDVNTFHTIVDGIGLFHFDGFIGPYTLNGAVISGRTYGTIVNVFQTDSPLPETFNLHQNFPNPFNPSTTIRYELTKASTVSMKIFNVLGQVVETLVDVHKEAGYYQGFRFIAIRSLFLSNQI
jgi:hypothetical protein